MQWASSWRGWSLGYCALSWLAASGAWLTGCAEAPPPAPTVAPAKPLPAPRLSAEATLAAEPALPQLTATSLDAAAIPGTFELTLSGRARDGAFEILRFDVPRDFVFVSWQRNEVALSEGGLPFAFVDSDSDSREPMGRLWVRLPANHRLRELTGDCFTADRDSGRRYHFHATIADQKLDPHVLTYWVAALVGHFEQRSGPFYGYAANTLRARLPKQGPPSRFQTQADADHFARLLAPSTGRSSVQEALEQNRPLYVSLEQGARQIPIEKLVAPRLTRHPWAAMLAQLPQKPGIEALATATPAEFYFLRVRDFASFLDLSSLAESWGTPALALLDGKVQELGLRDRYQTELALESGELSRAFGPSVIEELALVGSDPYLVEGSDLTLIFRVKSGLLFDAALLKVLTTMSAAHPGISREQFQHEGVEVSIARSSDGQIRRHRASVDGLELVSNSAAAIRRVISAIHGKTPRLADEPDFAYMLARDAERPAPVLAFAGDRFVESVVSPQQKIKAAERALALAELSRPGYAALLYGYLNGRSPTSVAELEQANLLSAADLKRGSVAASFQPGQRLSSPRGSTHGMLPLLDWPAISKVSAAERAGYEAFARGYEAEWSDYVDPFALRVSRTPRAAGGVTLDAELRVLPLLRNEYRRLTGAVGRARVEPGPLRDGFRVLLGVGKDAELRHLLTSGSHLLTREDFSFDWLGDYAFVGVAERNELVQAALHERNVSPAQPPSGGDGFDEERAIGLTPAYAGIAVRSSVGATLALTLLKKITDEVAPGNLVWSEARKHRGISVMSVRGTEHELQQFALYYALTPHALLFALNPAVLETVLDQYTDGSAPAAVDPQKNLAAPQFVLDLKGKQRGALFTVLSWLLTKPLAEQNDAARDVANAVFRGAPETQSDPGRAEQLMRNYFGSVARSPEGRSFGFGPDGVRDPLRGSASSPKWPVVPVPGSPVAQVLDRLESLRSEVSFDDEPGRAQSGAPLQSLRVHLSIQLRNN